MIRRSDLKLRLIGLLILIGLCVFYIFPIGEKINLGLDLKGGMYVLLRADVSEIDKDKVPNAISAAVAKLRTRIDTFGVKETSISIQGDKSILVKVPGLVDRQIIDKLKKVGKLEFKLVSDDQQKLSKALEEGPPEGYQLKDYKSSKLLIKEEPVLTGSDLSESFVGFDPYGAAEVRLRFTSEGADKFAKVTQENTGKILAITLDEKIRSTPRIQEAILGGRAQITGDFSTDEAKATSSILNSGALPVPLTVEEERSVGPLLGSDSIQRGINSIVLGSILVISFILVYYLLGGIITIICLALDLLFILAGLHMFGATLTLPGIAGMILTLGMAVDANVLIFERIREELRLEKPLSVAVRNGFDKAKRTIFDANLTTLIAALFLFIYGTGPIRGFATTLSLGIAASIFTAIFVGRVIFSYFLDLRLKKFPMLSIIPRSHINFIKLKNICLVISLVVVVFGLFKFYQKGEAAYGVDFTGGQNLEYKITPNANIADIRNLVNNAGFSDITIQEFKDIEGGIIVKSKNDIAAQLKQSLDDQYENVEELKVTTVGPRVGKVLRKKAIFAIIFSLLGILIYVAYRFKHFDFAFAAVIAVFHDVLISLGIMSLAGFSVNLLTVTALLTIAGYSINDTIVIYDRIREISPRMHKSKLSEIINVAINNTLSRSVITSLTTILVVLSIYLLGGEALSGFSFTLLIGIIAGTYSSIYIASPLVLFFRKSHLLHKVSSK
ncbi:MAG: protein translocase subunit SecD [Candidatus Omnitrophica bacterium]|nr:protein translocase subunit SecD [Candidatus Omnitrophota bacterium]MCF7893889.1 protein translocase subunit SecD [Candidatus Omnitrophota bacterium]